jgi:hypothetical protein
MEWRFLRGSQAIPSGACWNSDALRDFVRLSFLAPEITAAILQGHQQPELAANKLIRAGTLNSC